MTNISEHIKMRQVKEDSQVIGEFLDWLFSKEILLAEYDRPGSNWEPKLMPVYRSIENLLAAYFDIDLNKVEEEKRQMIDDLRAANQKKGEEK